MLKILVLLSRIFSITTSVRVSEIKYINKNGEILSDLKITDLKDWSSEQSQMIDNGFSHTLSANEPIRISKDYICLDGHHRLAVLKDRNMDINVTVEKEPFLNVKHIRKIIDKFGN